MADSIREPIIYLRGRRLAPNKRAAAPGQLIGIASVTIPWGRETITDPVDPQPTTIKLLERTPLSRFPARGNYIGAPVRIDSPRAAVTGFVNTVFTGQVTEQAAREITLGDGTRAVELTLTCADVPGIMSQRTIRGGYLGFTTGGSRTYPGAWKWRGYPQQTPSQRLAHMDGDAQFAQIIGTWALGSRQPTNALLDGVPGDDLPDAWTLIKQIVATHAPLGAPYLRSGNELEISQHMIADHIEFYRTPAGYVSIRPVTAGRLEADSLALDSDALDSDDVLPDLSIQHKFATVTAQLAKRILNITIKNGQQTDELEDSSETITVSVGNSTGSSRDLKLEMGAGASVTKIDGNEQPGSWPTETAARAATSEAAVNERVQYVADVLTNLNQYAKLPPITVRDEPDESQTYWPFYLFKPEASPGLWLAGSKWSGMRQAPRVVQMVGGELRWTGRRWEHEINFAPAEDPIGKSARIRDTIGQINDPISNTAADITVGMLPDVTRVGAL